MFFFFFFCRKLRSNYRQQNPTFVQLFYRNITEKLLQINVLSPSLLSLHNEGEGAEKAFSISNLLKATKMLQKQDQEEMLDLIAEASGVSDIVDDAKVVYFASKEW